MTLRHLAAAWAMAGLLAGCVTPGPQTAPPQAEAPRPGLAEAERAYNARQDARALELFLPQARAGNPLAQQRVARIYSRNQGVPVNETESCNWWEAAARQGEGPAMTNIGLCLETGKGRPQDHAAAAGWYRQAADKGQAIAMYNLGLAHEYGRGVPQGFDVAAQWFQRALDSGQLSSGNALDARRHLERALRHVKAARRDPQAMYEVAQFVGSGDGGERRDEKRGIDLMKQAAEVPGAVPDALFMHGLNVFHGRHRDLSDLRAGRPLTPEQIRRMESDQRDGAGWVRRAADAGHEEATFMLATWTACGAGVRKDTAAAERMLAASAERGSVRAMQELADFLGSGRCGMRKDAAAAARWQARATAAEEARRNRPAPR